MFSPGGKVGVKAPHRARLTTGAGSKEEEGGAKDAGGYKSTVQRGGQG